MKKICLILGICLAPGIVNAAIVDTAERGINLSSRAWAGYGASLGKWYKCTTSISGTSTQCTGAPGLKVYYTSISSGTGTQTDPYILSGCSVTASGAGCACTPELYYSNGTCTVCPTGTSATMPSAVGLHQTTTCNMCGKGYYRDSSANACKECPEKGESMGGAVPINACYIPKGTSFNTTPGTYEYTEDCHYSS